jgi:hypothetical protein
MKSERKGVRRSCTDGRSLARALLAAVLVLGSGGVRALGAQRAGPSAPSDLGSNVGLPPLFRPFVGGYFGVLGPPGGSAALGVGVYRDVLDPTVGLLGVQLEGYLAAASNSRGPQGSLALGVRSPTARLGAGVDVELPGGAAAPFLSIMHPVRRGGLLFRGGLLHATWVFGGPHRLRLGLALPVGQPLVGKDRPPSDHLELPRRAVTDVPAPAGNDGLAGAARDLRDWVLRVNQVVVPFVGPSRPARDPGEREVVDSLTAMTRLLALGAGRSANDVVGEYHASLERAFSLALDAGAAGITPQGRALADSVRALLLTNVLLPYARLLGQKRQPETLAPFAAAALDTFAAAASPAGGPAPDSRARAAWVLSRLLVAMDEVVASQRQRWGDARMVWLPLQLALRDEQHETQAQIDTLIQRATTGEFSDSNEVVYARNEQFQWEVYRSIHAAERYHVLWFSEFRGLNDQGTPDKASYRMVAHGYLDALIQRVQAYDSTGILPEYHIFLDEFYFELENTRLWMALLQDPLSGHIRVRGAPAAWQATLDSLQATLRAAVAGSSRLQAEERAHGAGWLRDRIAVHVHITQQADPSFWSRWVFPVVGLPDNALRDHRKIVFYDLADSDPYRGRLLVGGMGVGEVFAGAGWEDRVALVRGPATRTVRRQLERLMVGQGVEADRLPFFLRTSRDTVPGHVTPPTFPEGAVTAMPLHNEVGYGFKQVTIAKAILYSLMPAGSVEKIPDSLWNNPLWASLLVGHALRGGRVLIMAPAVANAPSPDPRALTLAEAVLARLLVARRVLAPAIDSAGGLLRVGVYAVDFPVGDIPRRIETALANRARLPWLRQLEPFSQAVFDSLQAVAAALRAGGFHPPQAISAAEEHPMLHIKAQFFASPEGWDNLFRQPGWGAVLATYFRASADLVQRRLQYLEFDRVPAASDKPASGGEYLQQKVTAERPERSIYFLTIGSHNEDYRSAMLDGETILVLSHFGAAVGIVDFVLLPSLCQWVDTREELDRYMPLKSGFAQKLAWATRILY